MRLTLPVVLAVLVAATIYFLALGSDDGVPTGARADTRLDRAPDAAARESKMPEREPTAGNSETSAPERREADESSGHVAHLIVVRADSKEPVALANVGYVSGTTLMSLPAQVERAIGRGEFAPYRRHGHVRKTDARGECRLPMDKSGLNVLVTFENLLGRAWITGNQTRPQTVELRADHDLVVSVTGHTGRPARDVTVMLERLSPHGPPAKYELGKTDAEGKLTWLHAQDLTTKPADRYVLVFAVGSGIESKAENIDLLSARKVEVALRMPRSGSITFQLVDETGKPFDISGHGRVELALTMHAERPDAHGTHIGRSPQRTFGDDGRVVVDQVAFDQFYSARVRRFLQRPQVGKGPTTERPDIVVPIVVRDSLVMFKGRVVDSNGAAISKRPLRLTCRHERGMSSQSSETGENGEFVIAMPYLEPGTKVDMTGQIGKLGSPVELACRIASGRTVTAGTNDLGKLEFMPPPLLLSGRLVLPESLASIRHVSWQVEKMVGRGWETLYELQTTWLADRHFEIRGTVAADASLRLSFGKGPYLPHAPLEFAPGTKDVEIELEAAGTIDATLLVDSWEWDTSLLVSLEREGTKKSNALSPLIDASQLYLYATEEGKLVYQWNGLLPGLYDLRVECLGARDPLVSIRGIRVISGKAVDNRLNNIDLRGRLRSVEISVIDEDSKPLPRDALVLVAATDGKYWRGHHLHDGKVRLALATSATIRVLAKGYRFTEVSDVREDRVVRLQRAPELRFRVKWPFPLPKGVTSQIQLEPQNVPGATRGTYVHADSGASGVENRVRSIGFVEPDGTAVIRPMVLGEQSIRIALDPDGRGQYFYGFTPRKLVVTGTETKEIVLEVSADGLRKSLDRMRRR